MLHPKYYKGVSERELEKIRDFLQTHPRRQIEGEGKAIPYYCTDRGEKTILTLSGAAPAEMLYEDILGFEEDFRVVAVDTRAFDSLDGLSEGVNRVLEAEGIPRVVIYGISMSGIFGQAYFRRNFEKTDALIVANAPAPKRERNKAWGFALIRTLPFALLKGAFKKKFAKFFQVTVPPEAEERLRFKQALLTEWIDSVITKQEIMNSIRLASEWNEKDEGSAEELEGWKGKALIITCEDDPYYGDADVLAKNLPSTEVYTFPKGMGHIPHILHFSRFQSVVKDFLAKL